MSRSRYPSDLTDEQWALLASAPLREHDRPGRPIDANRLRGYLDAIFYVLRTGCPWRHLPHDFAVPWSCAHQQFLRWTRRGTWDRVLITLREGARAAAGRTAKPTGAVVDSSSVKAGPVTGPRGFDGAKKIDGMKRHILTDTTGLLLAVEVTAANTRDRAALPAIAQSRCRILSRHPQGLGRQGLRRAGHPRTRRTDRH